jgi:hypothetical protein
MAVGTHVPGSDDRDDADSTRWFGMHHMIAAHRRAWMNARTSTLARVLVVGPPLGTSRYDLARCRVQSPRATHRRGPERAAPRHLVFESSRWCGHANVDRRTCPSQRHASQSFHCRATRQGETGVAPLFVDRRHPASPEDTWRFTPGNWGDQWSGRAAGGSSPEGSARTSTDDVGRGLQRLAAELEAVGQPGAIAPAHGDGRENRPTGTVPEGIAPSRAQLRRAARRSAERAWLADDRRGHRGRHPTPLTAARGRLRAAGRTAGRLAHRSSHRGGTGLSPLAARRAELHEGRPPAGVAAKAARAAAGRHETAEQKRKADEPRHD